MECEEGGLQLVHEGGLFLMRRREGEEGRLNERIKEGGGRN